MVQGLRDQHSKVRWAACQAVGQMCTDLGPDFQEAEHARLLPGLMAVMDDFNHPRIQAHSAAAVVNFSENCEQVPRSARPSAQATCMRRAWGELVGHPPTDWCCKHMMTLTEGA